MGLMKFYLDLCLGEVYRYLNGYICVYSDRTTLDADGTTVPAILWLLCEGSSDRSQLLIVFTSKEKCWISSFFSVLYEGRISCPHSIDCMIYKYTYWSIRMSWWHMYTVNTLKMAPSSFFLQNIRTFWSVQYMKIIYEIKNGIYQKSKTLERRTFFFKKIYFILPTEMMSVYRTHCVFKFRLVSF